MAPETDPAPRSSGARRPGALKTALDLGLVFGIVLIAAAIVLIAIRTANGDDPLGGREVWIGSGGLVILLADVAARAALPRR